jgi:hypothetical protein
LADLLSYIVLVRKCNDALPMAGLALDATVVRTIEQINVHQVVLEPGKIDIRTRRVGQCGWCMACQAFPVLFPDIFDSRRFGRDSLGDLP